MHDDSRKGERRFPNREYPDHLKAVRGMPCLLQGRRTTVSAWRGTYPNTKFVTYEAIHSCEGWGRVEAHHVILKSQGGSDDLVVPACKWAHQEIHQIGLKAFEERWQVSLKAEAVKLWTLLQKVRYFRVTFEDNDGEEQRYYLIGKTVWDVLSYIHVQMDMEGDFYGHKLDHTMNLFVDELYDKIQIASSTQARVSRSGISVVRNKHWIEVPQ